MAGKFVDFHRREKSVQPQVFESLPDNRSLWYETAPEQAEAERRARERAVKLEWLRFAVARCLSSAESRAIVLYYFKGYTTRQCARHLRCHSTTVHRRLVRAIRKLTVYAWLHMPEYFTSEGIAAAVREGLIPPEAACRNSGSSLSALPPAALSDTSRGVLPPD